MIELTFILDNVPNILYVNPSHIVVMYREKDQTVLLVKSGLIYKVQQTPIRIRKLIEDYWNDE